MTAPADRKTRWAAGADQIAHASTPKGTRTLCGLLPVLERFEWNPVNVCPRCLYASRVAERDQ